MPGADVLLGVADPVCVIASSGSLGLMISEVEVLVVVDRGDFRYYDRGFFAYVAEDGAVTIRRMDGGSGDAPPPGFTIAGRVALVLLPFDEATMAKEGTFMEDMGMA